MKLPTTKEEMLERFRLFGELFCLCYELSEGDYNCDIEVNDGDMVMLGFQGANYPFSQPAIYTPSATLQRVLDLLRRYADELNKED